KGTSTLKPPIPRTGDFRSGVTVEWKAQFGAPGDWRIHFEAVSADGNARWPVEGAHTIRVVSMVTQWVLFGVGLAISLFVLPMFVFFVARGMSRRVDPGATARFALVVGVLVAAGLYCWLFTSIYGLYAAVAVGVGALGVAFVLATMRR